MTVALNYTARVTIETCCVCGAPIALTNDETLRSTKATFYCPNGHSQSYSGTEIDNLKKQLATEKQRREMAGREVAMEKARAEKAEKATTRLKKRVRNGVCPCCNRSFQNLRRHMETKHPESKP